MAAMLAVSLITAIAPKGEPHRQHPAAVAAVIAIRPIQAFASREAVAMSIVRVVQATGRAMRVGHSVWSAQTFTAWIAIGTASAASNRATLNVLVKHRCSETEGG